MDPVSPKNSRVVAIADHIWAAFEEMAQRMGSDRDGLINQAMFAFARLNGFLVGSEAVLAGASLKKTPPTTPRSSSGVADARTEQDPTPGLPNTSWPSAAPLGESPVPHRMDEEPSRRQVAERVLEKAAELERLIQSRTGGEPPDDVERPAGEVSNGTEPHEEGTALHLMMDGGEMREVTRERFIIGRGKHCDFVIDSGKVSREHAAIVRQGTEYFIEDLGSSNGTWFNKQRINRRKVSHGDEYFICSDKIKVVMR